jgi:hypothetical protein
MPISVSQRFTIAGTSSFGTRDKSRKFAHKCVNGVNEVAARGWSAGLAGGGVRW